MRTDILDIETGEGRKRIGITRIHIEEDAGKLIHQEGKGTLIDYNRVRRAFDRDCFRAGFPQRRGN